MIRKFLILLFCNNFSHKTKSSFVFRLANLILSEIKFFFKITVDRPMSQDFSNSPSEKKFLAILLPKILSLFNSMFPTQDKKFFSFGSSN